ncbi:MAG TPA: hypothetical protein VM734_18495 [Kofleriaceae bacterium]|nr:hypothetical protein [Kofleriaceae bacterium]
MRRLLVVALAAGACSFSASAPDPAEVDAAPPAGPPAPDVVAIAVAGDGDGPPAKGTPARVTLTVRNDGDGAGTVRLTPLVTSARFTDFTDVPLGTVEVALAPGTTADAVVSAGPFLTGDDGARYALGRGDYTITGVRVERDGAEPARDTTFTGGAFGVVASDVVFNVVLYDPAYFTAIGWTDAPEAYVGAAFTRAAELFTPSSPGSNQGTYRPLAGGFDELMGVEQQSLVLSGLAASEAAGGFCEQVGAQARTSLGLERDWDIDEGQPTLTDVDHHGFDILIGLTPAMGGGAACGWLGVQVSGLFDFDLSLERSQIILVHESGHLFGAPHCDPLQGYVMCAGERHDHYRDGGVFVWHQVSRDAMANRWR